MAFTFKLVHEDGTPAKPPSFETVVPNWRAGDTISLGRDTSLVVIDTRQGPDEQPVLVVEWAQESG